MKTVVLLYNDRDRRTVEAVGDALDRRWSNASLATWIAYRKLSAFGGDIFEQIETAIEGAAGVVVFLGAQGLGRFQRNIELGAVNTERWQRGADFGVLLVHLAAGLDVPRPLLRWPSFNYDGALNAADDLADGISERFGVVATPASEP